MPTMSRCRSPRSTFWIWTPHSSGLAAFDARKSRIAELRFFGGLSLEEMGLVLDVSAKTVERDWQLARAWLFKTLSGQQERRDA